MNLKYMFVMPIGFAIVFSMVVFGYMAMAYCRIFPNNTIFVPYYRTDITVEKWKKDLRLF